MKFSIKSLFFLLFCLSILLTVVLNWHRSRNLAWGINENLGVDRCVLLRDGRIDDRFMVEVRRSPLHSISIVRQLSLVRDNMAKVDTKFDLGFSNFDMIRKHGELKGGIVVSLGLDETRNFPIPDHMLKPLDGPDPLSAMYKDLGIWCNERKIIQFLLV